MKRSAQRPRLSPDGFEPGAVISRLATDDLSARFAPSTHRKAEHTIEAVFSAGTRISRWGVLEELAISTDAVDLSRVALGQVRLLDSHNQWSKDAVLGVVIDARIEGGSLVGTVRFADTDAGRAAEGMALRGEMTGLSVGYRVRTWTLVSTENETEVWRADKWELLEVSMVAVPADPQAQFRAADNDSTRAAPPINLENDDMRRSATQAAQPHVSTETTEARAVAPAATAAPSDPVAAAPAPATDPVRAAAASTADPASAAISAERARAGEIHDIGIRAGMAQSDITAAIAAGTGVEAFRVRAFDFMAERSNRYATTGVTVARDETQTRHEALQDALTLRIGGAQAVRNEETGEVRPVVEAAREYARHSLADMAAVLTGARHMPRDAAQREDVLRRAFTTSDFPIIFQHSINRVLAARYAVAAPSYRRIATQRNFRDFRPHTQIRVGDFPKLQKVLEGGEIKFAAFGESKEVLAVVPYGVQFAITRQMLVNDDIGAIDQMLGSYGDMVARFEEDTFYAMKGTIGPVLLEDSKAVFHADHGNLAGTPSVIDTANLGKGRAAMRKQKNQSGTLLNVTPRILLVGPDKETEADMAVAVITPTSANNVNPFSNKLEVVSAPVTGNAWELYADPAVLPVWAWGMLDGYKAPRLRMEEEFGVQGVKVSLEHDFGCGAIDFRGAYRNAGA